MAKTRMINTRLWNDTWVSNLDPIEKLLFIYCLSNEHTNISGVYELPLKVAAIETGIDQTMFDKIIPRLKPKVFFFKGWVIIPNFPKYQSIDNPKVQLGVKRALEAVPSHIKEKAIAYGYPMGSLGMYLDSDLDSDSDTPYRVEKVSEENSKSKTPRTPATDAFMGLFKVVNPSWKSLTIRPNEIKAVLPLLEQNDMDWWEDFLPKYAVLFKNHKYCPKAATPSQMLDKLSAILAFINSNQKEPKKKVVIV